VSTCPRSLQFLWAPQSAKEVRWNCDDIEHSEANWFNMCSLQEIHKIKTSVHPSTWWNVPSPKSFHLIDGKESIAWPTFWEVYCSYGNGIAKYSRICTQPKYVTFYTTKAQLMCKYVLKQSSQIFYNLPVQFTAESLLFPNTVKVSRCL